MFRYRFTETPNSYFPSIKAPRLVQISKSHDHFNWNTPHHAHSDITEIAFIENGSAWYQIGEHSFVAKRGDLIILEREVLHSLTSSSDDPTNIWVIYVDKLAWGTDSSDRLLPDKKFALFNTGIYSDFIVNSYKTIKHLYETDSKDAYSISQCILTSLVAVVLELQKGSRTVAVDSRLSFIRTVMYYLNEHYKENTTLKDLSEKFNVSPSYISHEFVNEYGISPINYIINRKLCEAKWLLVSTKQTLSEIAFSLGYENVNHFTRIFTKRIGCSPANYREMYYEEGL